MIVFSDRLRRRLSTVMAVAGIMIIFLAGLSGCARRDVLSLADRQPALDLADFFAGESVAYGIFEDRFGNLRRQFRVNMVGTVEGDTLTLDEDFLYDDGERAKRVWVITRMDDDGGFRLLEERVTIPQTAREFAINASNRRHWPAPITRYVDGCLAGADGPRGKDFNMRWVASLVAETWRIISRGGVFLYPSDARKGYESGRLRLVYEAAPVAILVEQAGGRATDGAADILDIVPQTLHQRVPLVFGPVEEVAALTDEYAAD